MVRSDVAVRRVDITRWAWQVFFMASCVRVSLLAFAISVSGGIIASYAGTAQALHWPLSEANSLAAIMLGFLVGAVGSGATIAVTLRVRPPYVAWSLGIGGALTALISGLVSFVVNAVAAAC